jgi:hypothetical protein
MILSKFFLPLFLAFTLKAPETLATRSRYQASLICESGGRIFTETGANRLYPCYIGDCRTETVGNEVSFGDWSNFLYSRMTHIRCADDNYSKPGLCHRNQPADYCTDENEAVVTVVKDRRTRRLGTRDDAEGLVDFGGKPTLEVEFERGEKWTLVNTNDL